jgi:hypothetical protein
VKRFCAAAHADPKVHTDVGRELSFERSGFFPQDVATFVQDSRDGCVNLISVTLILSTRVGLGDHLLPFFPFPSLLQRGEGS